MGDAVLHASSVEVNVEFGTCFKNITEQKMNDGHLQNVWRVYFLNLWALSDNLNVSFYEKVQCRRDHR